MSPNVGNFVHDLVEMAKAMETLPQVQQALSSEIEANSRLINRINELNADLEQSRTYAATLEQKVRTVEAERDDAEIRFLELEDKTSHVLASIRDTQTWLADAVAHLDPPKPQPEPEPAPQPVPEVVQSMEAQPQGQDETLPTTAPNTVETFSTNASCSDANAGPAPQPPVSQGQGEVNPTQSPVLSQVENVDTSLVSNQDSASSTTQMSNGLYANKRYVDIPGYVSRWDWIEGGGTDESYDWRPPVPPQTSF